MQFSRQSLYRASRVILPIFLIAVSCFEPTAGGEPGGAAETPSVSLTVVSVEPGRRPPKSFWVFDVELANRGAEARWFLIPDPAEKSLELERGAHAIDVVSMGSEPAIRMLRISATHGLLALRLGPGSELQLRGLRLTSWDEEPLRSIEIWAVRELLFDGEPLGAEVLDLPDILFSGSAAADADSPRKFHSWFDPQLASHELTYEADERWEVDLTSPG